MTPRGPVDCMVAAVAIDSETPVLAHGRGFAAISGVVTLELDVGSLRP